jgi:anti-sigma B factor antagonist
MKLDIHNREVKGISILDLGGRLTLGEESNALREEVKQLLDADKKNILLNVADVTYIDSTGIATLVQIHKSSQAKGGTLKLLSLSKKFQETLQLTRLLTVFETFNNETQALASFK